MASRPSPKAAWSPKRRRQYDHIKDSLEEQGRSEDLAEEIAARTVNKERARAGESQVASPSSTDDISSGRRGGLRSHKGPGGRTYKQLYAEARRHGIDGRSKMSKEQRQAYRRPRQGRSGAAYAPHFSAYSLTYPC